MTKIFVELLKFYHIQIYISHRSQELDVNFSKTKYPMLKRNRIKKCYFTFEIRRGNAYQQTINRNNTLVASEKSTCSGAQYKINCTIL